MNLSFKRVGFDLDATCFMADQRIVSHSRLTFERDDFDFVFASAIIAIVQPFNPFTRFSILERGTTHVGTEDL
ncbi:hypothetical protein [Stieleria neptunia]|uniref:hypothetical protein n=1 Tax=Stieleria neptunia TaxID=2527979 RepID=UPI0011A15DCA|nr:hypothetical protein [Stieleria neptunia]